MIPKETVLKIADLARLQLSESELDKYTDQLNQILGHVEKLNELDTRDIVATSHAVEVPNPMRADQVVPSSVIEKVLEISPDHEETFFKVPKVL
jgi:aspartyl/glutamyl-tRNA(Asn/Gln) amidotransferase, C subunit